MPAIHRVVRRARRRRGCLFLVLPRPLLQDWRPLAAGATAGAARLNKNPAHVRALLT